MTEVLNTKEISVFYITLEKYCIYPTYKSGFSVSFYEPAGDVLKKRKRFINGNKERAERVFYRYCKEAEKEARQKEITTTAQRLYNFDVFGARDAGATVESIAQDIEKEPINIIKYLLDYIEEIEA